MAVEYEVADRGPRPLIALPADVYERLREPRILLGFVTAALGVAAVIGGWLGVSGTLNPGKQLPYVVSGGIGGLFLLGMSALFFLSGQLGFDRAEAARLRKAVEALASDVEQLRADLQDR